MADPVPLPLPGKLPDPFATGAAGPGAGALAMGRLGDFGATAPATGANSDLQRSYQSAPGGLQAPAGVSSAATTAELDPAAQYAALFGTTTPQARVAAGLPPVGPIQPPPVKAAVQPPAGGGADTGVPPNGGGADNAPKAPAATPQQAGDNNSVMPGWSNGNPVVGTPAIDQGVNTAGVDTKSPLAPLPPATSSPEATPLPQPAQFPPVTTPVGAAAVMAPTSTREPGAPVAAMSQTPVATAAAGTQAGGTREPQTDATKTKGQGEPTTPLPVQTAAPGPDVQQKAAAAATAPSSTVNYGGAQVTLPRNMTQAQFDALTPDQRWRLVGTTYKAPDALKTVTGKDMSQIDITKYPPHVRDVISNAVALQNQYDIAVETAKTAGNNNIPAVQQNLARLQVRLNNAKNELATKWGITYQASTPETGGGGGGTDGGTSGGGTGTQTGGGGGTTVGGSSSGQTGPDTEDTNYVLSDQPINSSGGYTAALEHFIAKYGKTQGPVIFEAAMAAIQNQNKRNDTQSGVDIMHGGQVALEHDPLFTGSQTLAKSILDNPDPTDWEAIRSRKIADAQGQGLASLRALGANAARRLGSGAGGATMAMAGDIQREANRGLSNDLGDLAIQKSQQGRAMEENALQTALTTMAGTTGVDLGINTNIANLMAGNQVNDTNPYSGVGAAFANLNALKEMADAKKAAGQFSWQDAAGLVGTLGGAFLGGPLGAVALGGARTAAGK